MPGVIGLINLIKRIANAEIIEIHRGHGFSAGLSGRNDPQSPKSRNKTQIGQLRQPCQWSYPGCRTRKTEPDFIYRRRTKDVRVAEYTLLRPSCSDCRKAHYTG